jgi:hypothetical protein
MLRVVFVAALVSVALGQSGLFDAAPGRVDPNGPAGASLVRRNLKNLYNKKKKILIIIKISLFSGFPGSDCLSAVSACECSGHCRCSC